MRRCVLAVALSLVTLIARSESPSTPVSSHNGPPPISAFARGEDIISGAISPDGRYLAVLTTLKGLRVAMVGDLTKRGSPMHLVMSSAADYKFFIQWCKWATAERLLCGLRGAVHDLGTIYIATRLAAVDADGKNLKVLVQGQEAAAAGGQLQDQIVDWNPGKPNTELIATQANLLTATDRAIISAGGGLEGRTMSEFPNLYELDVVTGQMHLRQQGRSPWRRFITDEHGEARLAWGYASGSDKIQYDVRDSKSGSWQRLLEYHAFSDKHVLQPIAMCPGQADCAYAIGESEGRDAVWRIDLTGKSQPTLEFAHPAVDIDDPLFSNDGHLLGMAYETDRPFIYYTDPGRERVMRGLKNALPGTFIVIEDATRDEQQYLVRTTSDIDAGTYYLLNVAKGELAKLGTAYPELDPATLGRMQSISYQARDGTRIPGFLTVPPGLRAEHLPLIVMPHGGPIERDRWQFDFLRAFLVSRGYAVLQMNFRGSSGYGTDWFHAAHQDWGGLTYSDIADGARWALKEGITDPGKLCIVGWSFGGYAALLGAVRDSDLYRCAASIAGISDLSLLESEARYFASSLIAMNQIGSDSAKLKADSPRRHVEDVHIPVLMIHGDLDAQANVEQSEAMDKALTKAGKPHEFLLVPGADHQMSRESDRTTLLSALEKFLAKNLGPGVSAPPQ
jgi:dipeptidyl aminopeptidase/acylaminoacyl peptidase